MNEIDHSDGQEPKPGSDAARGKRGIRLPTGLYAKLQAKATLAGKSLSEYITDALTAFLKKQP